ncbi:MAG: PQQ-like beta-propeller repeat protein [Deltaproteobacteria bacterium]|nr:PQQ-like beta-propeller repeat protein [Deltaproteobacteria bacterium]
MSARRRILLAAQVTAVVIGVAACGATIDYVQVGADGGDGSAGSSDAGDGDRDASESPDRWAGPEGGYVRDPGRQSGAMQITAVHTSATADPSLAGRVARRWSKAFSGPASFPLIAHDKVVVTYATADGRGEVQAFDAATGASVWGPLDLGESSTSSSAYDGGRVFSLTRKGTLRAFDVDTGALQWTTELGNPAVPIQFLAAPTAYEGKVYVMPSNFGKAFAVNEVTGTVAWTSGSFGTYASPAVTDDAVYIAINCETAYRLDPATGAVVWHVMGNCNSGAHTPAVFAGKLLVGGDNGSTTAIDLETGDAGTTRIGGWHAGAYGGMIYLAFNGTLDGRSFPAKPSGNVYWSTQDRMDPGMIRAAPMIAGGRVHALWSDCTLRAFEPLTGDLLWTDSEPAGCEGPGAYPAGPVSIAAAAGTIVVPFGSHIVTYGVTPASDGGADASGD